MEISTMIWLASVWLFSLVLAFTAGEMRGQSKNDKWWHEYGPKYLAQRGALIYGTALYKEQSAANGEGKGQ